MHESLKDLNPSQKKELITDITLVLDHINQAFKLFYEMDYDSHYMDRTQSIMSSVAQDLRELKEGLEKDEE